MTVTTYNADARAEATERLLAGIARLEACKLDDMVLAWPYGLGVKLNGNTPSAVSLNHATPITGRAPIVANGNNEPASLVRRQDAIAQAITEIRKTIKMLEVI